jgi:hypothetical protein
MADAEFGQIFALHPRPTELPHDVLLRCVDECLACGASCTACADASLSEDDVEEMRASIRLCLDCADLCDTTKRIVLRQTALDVHLLGAVVRACAVACRVCAAECEKHAAHHEHCRLSAQACERCEAACLAVCALTDA